MRLIDAEVLFDKVGNIMPNSQRQHDDIGGFMNMITSSPTVDAVPVSVIEDIKAEIKEKMDDCATTSIYTRLGFDTALNIIDKHISGKGKNK